jgi:hypothetical protein
MVVAWILLCLIQGCDPNLRCYGYCLYPGSNQFPDTSDPVVIDRPFGWIIRLLFGLFANTVTLMIANWLLPSLQIDSWAWAFLGSLVFSAINIVLTNLLTIDDENSLYQRLVDRLARRRM